MLNRLYGLSDVTSYKLRTQIRHYIKLGGKVVSVTSTFVVIDYNEQLVSIDIWGGTVWTPKYPQIKWDF
jgi:hypothetical protein